MDVRVNIDTILGNEVRFTIAVGKYSKKYFANYPFDLSLEDLPFAELMALMRGITIANFDAESRIFTNFEVPSEVQKMVDEITYYNYISSCKIFGKDLEDYQLDFVHTPLGMSLDIQKEIGCGETPHRVVNFMSGGIDSTLSYCISKELGLNPIGYTTLWSSIGSNRGLEEYTKRIFRKYDIPFITARTNYNQAMSLVRRIFNLGEDVRDQNMANKYYLCCIGMDGIFNYTTAIMFANRIGADYVLAGDELAGMGDEYQGVYFAGVCVTDQSYEFHKFMTDYARFYGLKVQSGSVLMPLDNIPEYKIIHEKFPQAEEFITSCLTQINRYCYHCDKCFRTLLYFYVLGIDPKKRWNFDENELFRKCHRFEEKGFEESFWTPHELSHLKHCLLKKEEKLPKLLRHWVNFHPEIPAIENKTVECVREALYYTIPSGLRQKVVDFFHSCETLDFSSAKYPYLVI